MNRDGSCPLPSDCRKFWIATRSFTARCAEGKEGDSVTVTQQYKSYISLQHAESEARRIARARAEAALTCSTLEFFGTATAYKQCNQVGIIRGADGNTIYIEWTAGNSLPAGALIQIGDDIFTVVSTADDTITVEEDTGEDDGFLAYSTGEAVQLSTGELIATTS